MSVAFFNQTFLMDISSPPPLPGHAGSFCQGCQTYAPTKQVMFFRHIGAIILMFNAHVRGRLCRSCVNEQFAQTTLVTSFAGWWGMISFFLTPFFLLNNVVRYLFCLTLKPAEGESARGTVVALLALLIATGALSGVACLWYSVIHR